MVQKRSKTSCLSPVSARFLRLVPVAFGHVPLLIGEGDDVVVGVLEVECQRAVFELGDEFIKVEGAVDVLAQDARRRGGVTLFDALPANVSIQNVGARVKIFFHTAVQAVVDVGRLLVPVGRSGVDVGRVFHLHHAVAMVIGVAPAGGAGVILDGQEVAGVVVGDRAAVGADGAGGDFIGGVVGAGVGGP